MKNMKSDRFYKSLNKVLKKAISPTVEENFLATLNFFKCICMKIFIVRKLERSGKNTETNIKPPVCNFIKKR